MAKSDILGLGQGVWPEVGCAECQSEVGALCQKFRVELKHDSAPGEVIPPSISYLPLTSTSICFTPKGGLIQSRLGL